MRNTINISLAPIVYAKAKECSEGLGLTLSAFISMLIANYKR